MYQPSSSKREALPTLPSLTQSTGSLLTKKGSTVSSVSTSMKPAPFGSVGTLRGDASLSSGSRVSKLEAEVLRLEHRGAQLIRTSGSEVEGIMLLEKALWARTRFASLQGGNADAVWQRGEGFVVTCNQLAAKVMQTLEDGYVHTANQLMAAAERALCNSAMDPFAGFHILRQRLLGLTLCNHAALQRINGEPAEVIVMSLEKALAVQHPRPTTIALLNLAAAYVQAKQFDDAVEVATRCIALANHYLTLPPSAAQNDPQLHREAVEEAAAHAVLTHHLIATVAHWAGGMRNVEVHHVQLAFACATQYLGTHHALTTRCINRLDAVERGLAIEDPDERSGADAPPIIALQLSMLPGRSRPSLLLPFTLAFALPPEATLPPPRTVDHTVLPPIGQQTLGQRPATTSSASTALVASAATQNWKGKLSASASTPQQRKRTTDDVPRIESARKPTESSAAAAAIGVPAPPIRGGRPLFTREAALSSSSGSPLIPVPAPPSAPRPKQVSVMPRREFELYQELQQQVRRYVETTERENSFARRIRSPIASYMRHGVETVSGLPPHQAQSSGPDAAVSGGVGSLVVELANGSQLNALHLMDNQLERISQVFPDHTDAEERMWNAAIKRLQRWYRGCRARAVFHKKQRERDAYLRRLAAQASIRYFWQSFQRIQAARAILEERRAIKARNDAAALVQSFARTHLSLERYGQLVLDFHIAEVRKWDAFRQRRAAAITIQSLFRGFRWRSALERRNAAARVVQRTLRWRRAFDVCRMICFNRRIARRNREALLNATATTLQRWALRCLNAKAANREVARRRAALEAHFADFFGRDLQYWLLVRDVDEVACVRTLQRAGRALLSRLALCRFRANTARRDRAARTLQRWFSFLCADNVRLRRALLVADRRRIQCRIEEVREATVDIQALVRGFLARVQFRKRLAVVAKRHAAARVIQRMARRAINRGALYRVRDERARRGERYERMQLRIDAATRIQSIYRMRRDRINAARFKRFMLVDRHALATRIQRLARRFIARVRRQELLDRRVAASAAQRTVELREASARRIQAVVRMFLEKIRRRSSITEPIQKRRAAAKRIQTAWRRFAAMSRVAQLHLARAHVDHAHITEEHRAVYAMQIQSAARRAFLNGPKVEAAAARRCERSVLVIQRTARRYLGRLHVARLLIEREEQAEREFDAEELHFAALRIQKTLRSHRARQELLRKIAAVTRIANWFRCIAARRRVATLRAARAEAERAEMLEDEDRAAAVIQQAWRQSHTPPAGAM